MNREQNLELQDALVKILARLESSCPDEELPNYICGYAQEDIPKGSVCSLAGGRVILEKGIGTVDHVYTKPKGWRLLNEGEVIPQIYQYYSNYTKKWIKPDFSQSGEVITCKHDPHRVPIEYKFAINDKEIDVEGLKKAYLEVLGAIDAMISFNKSNGEDGKVFAYKNTQGLIKRTIGLYLK